jgi:hypothetical protein
MITIDLEPASDMYFRIIKRVGIEKHVLIQYDYYGNEIGTIEYAAYDDIMRVAKMLGMSALDMAICTDTQIVGWIGIRIGMIVKEA